MKQKSGEPLNYSKEKQGELFAEFQTQQAKGAPYLKKGMLSGKKFTLNLSYENIILVFISLIMLLVIFFSLGVEKGKRLVQNNRREHSTRLKNEISEEETMVKNNAMSEKKESDTAEYKRTVSEEIEIEGKREAKEKTTILPLKPYTIQVVAFKKTESANREMERLKNKGFDTFLIHSDKWIQVCVGRYINKEASKNDFEILEKKYPKCYFRKISN